MKKYLKKSIVLSIVPVFVFAGCSNNEEQARLAVPNYDSEVVVNKDGSYTQEVAPLSASDIDAAPDGDENQAKLVASFDEAQAKGYTGTMDEWIALVQMHETNPEQAQAEAEESGFSGGSLLMGALAGAAVGALLASSASSRSGLASNSYSAQRYNNNTKYAYSRPKDEQQNTSSGGGGGGAAAAAVAARSNANSTTARSSSSSATPRATTSYSSVSRGGFGGAVSSGG